MITVIRNVGICLKRFKVMYMYMYLVDFVAVNAAVKFGIQIVQHAYYFHW